MKCSVYIVCPSILSCINLKLHQILEVKNIFKQENRILQLTFNPGLTLTGFRTTRPWPYLICEDGAFRDFVVDFLFVQNGAEVFVQGANKATCFGSSAFNSPVLFLKFDGTRSSLVHWD